MHCAVSRSTACPAAVSFILSRDVYLHNRHDKFTVLFCLLLGDIFIDTLLYDGVGKSLPSLPDPNISISKSSLTSLWGSSLIS